MQIVVVSNELWFLNVGETTNAWRRKFPGPFADRNWENCEKYGFITAGQGREWSKQLEKLELDDIVVAFIAKHGYVGIGKVIERAVPINEFLLDDIHLRAYNLFPTNIFLNENDLEKCEYVVRIKWFEGKTRLRENACWKLTPRDQGPKLFSPERISATLLNQRRTIDFIENWFNVKFIIN